MADYSEQTASATSEAENTGSEANPGESSNSIQYPVDRLVTENNIAHSTDGDDNADNSNLVLRCQFCKRHVQCIDDKITTLDIYGESSQSDNPHHTIKALNCSRCNHKTIGVQLCQQWWQLDEALKSATPRTDGFHEVTTYGERIVLFLLNSVIYPQQDFQEDCDIPSKPFHPCQQAKLLWNSNTIIGFYSYKQQGASLNDHVGVLCTWSIPVLDSLYIRKEHRGQEYGIQVLQDYLAMYKEGPIGIAQPCSKPFIKVCHKYLKKHPEDRARLWLCTPPGDEDNRVSLWRHSKKLIKQCEKTSATATTSSTTSTQMSSLVSPPTTSSFPTTSLLETLASVSESRRLAGDAEANVTHVVDSGVSEGLKGDAATGSDGRNVQSRRQEDAGDGVSSASASSCQNNCKEEHQSGVRCQGCKTSSTTPSECTNGHSGSNAATCGGVGDNSNNADSSEALANFSEETSRSEEAYKKTGDQMDVEPQNIASSSSVLYETEDVNMTSHEAETTAMDLSAKRPNVTSNGVPQNSVDHSKGDDSTNRKREVDSSIISADDDRSVGGGEQSHGLAGGDNCEDPDQQTCQGNGDLLKNLLRKPKVVSNQEHSGVEPVHTSGTTVKVETKPSVNDLVYSSHTCQSTQSVVTPSSDSVEIKPVISVKSEHEADKQDGLSEGVHKVERPEMDHEALRMPDEPMDSSSSTVNNSESVGQLSPSAFTDEHIRQLLTKDDDECTSPTQPVRPSRPVHPVQIIHNPLAGENREAAETQPKEGPGLLSSLLTGFPPPQVENPTALIAGSDSDSQQSVENIPVLGSLEQNTAGADSMTGHLRMRRPLRIRDYSTWFTGENYSMLSRQQGQKRRSQNGDHNNETGAMSRTWKRNRRTGALERLDRLRHPSWSVWQPVQTGEPLQDPIPASQGLAAGDANSRSAGVTVRELLQRHVDVPGVEPSSTITNTISTSTYTPTSTAIVYSNSMGQQSQQTSHIPPTQPYIPVTSYNAFASAQEKQGGEPPIGHFHTFRWTRPRKVYARRGTRHPSAPARSSTPDSSFDEIRPVAPFTSITDDQSSRAEALGQPPPQTQDSFTSTHDHFTQSGLDSQEAAAASSVTVSESSTQSREVTQPQVSSPNASTSSDGDGTGRSIPAVAEGNSSLIKQLLLREPGIHAPKPEAAHRQACAHEARVSQSQSTDEEPPRGILREEGEISSHQRGDQEEFEEEEDADNKAALRLQLGINVGVSVGARVNYRNTQTSNYSCEHCDIMFADSVMYVLHMGCHGRRSAFECNRCGLVCRDKYEFAIHFIQGEHNKD